MTAYVQVLMYAIPGFTLLIIIEFVISRLVGKDVYRGVDTISSLSSGLTNIIKDVLGLVIVIMSYAWMVEKLALFSIESSLLLYVLAFIGKDFASYWAHRFEHVINIFWNRHLVHHSSEEFNLACALRQPLSSIFAIFFFLYIPMAIIGIPAKVVAVVAPIHLFLQFWYHTRLVDKMGFLEYLIVTPSHHRVHHAINDEYIDKNYAAIFIIWDRIFGTFQEELAHVPPVYGIKRPAQTWNPVIINFQHLWLLIKDAWRTQSWYDKLRIWFMPTGWRPKDVAMQHEVHGIKDVYNFTKYDTKTPLPLLLWSGLQLGIHNLLMFHLFLQMPTYSFDYILAGGIFLFISIFAYTSLMDRSILAILAEMLKFCFALILMNQLGGWYNLDSLLPFGNVVFIVYLFFSLFITAYYTSMAKSRQKVVTAGG